MIFEDDDDLGYYFLPDHMRSNSFGSALDRSLLARCNSILLPGEQRAIMAAACAAHKGDHETAEEMRERTDYAGLPYRPDVDGQW